MHDSRAKGTLACYPWRIMYGEGNFMGYMLEVCQGTEWWAPNGWSVCYFEPFCS